MSSKASALSFAALGSISLDSLTPDLIEWAEGNGVDLDALDIDRTPRLGFRVGWSHECPGGGQCVVVDLCQFTLVNGRPGGAADEYTLIQRMELPKQQAIAFARLILAAAENCEDS